MKRTEPNRTEPNRQTKTECTLPDGGVGVAKRNPHTAGFLYVHCFKDRSY
ncbi:hypothetical protein BN2475_340177 [Paraburkholderia ribeironis]|uniref:Uncharacterized protein n=1 Tax=Paraburkholderia ribeironis TaxID=1247936 RepID=A0A1N7S4E0_9BURK|nr:hypothetical protein BN2475_340177 [Paraburkholderia ribeironis]